MTLFFRGFIWSFILIGFLWTTVFASHGADPRKMTFDPVDFDPPKAERIELPKGMILYLLEDHTLPLVNIQVMIKTGTVFDPADQVGLAALTGAVMRRGGARHKSSDAIDEELEFMAAELDIGIDLDRGVANLNLLKKDLDQGLGLFADLLMYPAFEEEKLDLTKQAFIEGILRRNDSPHSIARRFFKKLVYGEEHPYGRESTVESIQSIQREDLVAFHRNYFRPNNSMVAISGDVQKDEIVNKIAHVFSSWEEKEVKFPSVPPVKPEVHPSVNYIFKDVPQTTIRMGHLGVKRDNPDFFALSVMNDILGSGGFGSRLFQEVRTRQGLAYSAGSIFQPGNFDLGIFLAYSETKSASTLKTIRAILDEIKRIRKEPVSDEELKQAKDSFLNSFVFSFANPTQIVTRQMRLEYMGLPEDFLDTFRDRVAQVTKEDILRVARQYLKPDRLIILTVGRQDNFDSPLSTLGEVHEIPLEEPQPVTGS